MSRSERFAALANAAAKAKQGAKKGEYDTHEYYYPARDKAGNGFAVIRFLPEKNDKVLPFVKKYSHNFKNEANGKWFIEECPTTKDEPCPVCDSNSQLWASDKATVRLRKRKLHYILNILVVTDSKNPENEGKVMLFKCGAMIFDKINNMLNPPKAIEGDEQKEPIDVFDPVEGANFKFRIRKVDDQTNYDTSEFSAPSPIVGDIKKMLEEAEDLEQFVAPDKYKTYDELKKKLDYVWGNTSTAPAMKSDSDAEFAKNAASAQKNAAQKTASTLPDSTDDDDSDDDMKRFLAMAQDD